MSSDFPCVRCILKMSLLYKYSVSVYMFSAFSFLFFFVWVEREGSVAGVLDWFFVWISFHVLINIGTATLIFIKITFIKPGFFLQSLIFFYDASFYSQKNPGKIVWKHRPNSPLYVLMLRTKLHQNPFLLTEHQNVNKPKSGIVIVSLWTHTFTFLWVLSGFCSFHCQDSNRRCYAP